MNEFVFERALDIQGAIGTLQDPGTVLIGGGTNLLDLMKGGVTRPRRVVDINSLPLAGVSENANGGVSIGALTRNSDLANHPLIRTRYPLLSQALLAGASGQLRNMATVGGNLLQRTRCYYFYDTAFGQCNKRNPGSGCAAREGFNRIHAIFGASDACVAVNPSDMNVALLALDATVRVVGPRGERMIPMADFHRLPGDRPEQDTNLQRDELITAVELPVSTFSDHSHYLKVRDRASYAFALVSVGVGLSMDGGTVRNARIVMGGVAHKPWRAGAAEALLVGRGLDAGSLEAAADAAVSGAQPLAFNAFKVGLARRSVRRALEEAGGVA